MTMGTSRPVHELIASVEGVPDGPPRLPDWAVQKSSPAERLLEAASDNWYLRSAREYSRDKATGDRLRAALGWVAGISVALNIVLTVTLAHVATQSKVRPFIVQVDEHGYSIPIQPALETDMADPRVHKAVTHELARWVEDWRRIVTDPAAQDVFMGKVFERTPLDTQAHADVMTWYEKNSYETLGHTCQPVVHFIKPVSDQVWQAEWTERYRTPAGITKSARFAAMITIATSPTETFDDVVAAGFGLYVTHLQVQQLQAAR